MASTPHHIIDDSADAASLAGSSTKVTANFDDIKIPKSGQVAIKDGYSKMDWDNFYAINPGSGKDLQKYKGSGYDTGLTSGKQDAYNGDGAGCSIHLLGGTFMMNSVEMSAAFYKDLTVEIYGRDKNFDVKHDIKVHVNDLKATLITLNWTDVTEVDFQYKDGKIDPKWGNKGDEESDIVFDDFKFSDIKGKSGAPVQTAQHSIQPSILHGHFDAMHTSAHLDTHTPVHAIA